MTKETSNLDLKTMSLQLKAVAEMTKSILAAVQAAQVEAETLHSLSNNGKQSVPAEATEDEAPKSALDLLREMVARDNYVVLDTETTGLHDGEICQIAIVDSGGYQLLYELVKPVHPIPPEATRVHGITNDRVKDADPWPVVALKVKDILQGKDVIAYNATYDRKMMHKAAEKAGLEKIDWKSFSTWACAMEAFAEFYGEWNSYHGNYKWQRLSFAADHCGVKVDRAHDAMGDVLMTLGVVKHITK